MQNSIIKEMFFGNCGNYENMKRTENEDKLAEIFNNIYSEYTINFTKEQKHTLDQLIKANEDLWGEIADEHYFYGFKVGILIGVECSSVFSNK